MAAAAAVAAAAAADAAVAAGVEVADDHRAGVHSDTFADRNG